MILRAIGKHIDTTPISNLLSWEESRMDVVTFEVDRFHDGTDLGEFHFIMRGITESGSKTQQTLETEVLTEKILLHWRIDGLFTTEPGMLYLDLFACDYMVEPMQTIRYQLPPVTVRNVPPPGEDVQNSELTSLLARIQEEADDAIRRVKRGIHIVTLTQSEFDSLNPPDPDTIYLIYSGAGVPPVAS